MQDIYTHDSLGRVVIDQSENNDVEISRTTTVYNGDRVTVVPPVGGVATTTKTDPLESRHRGRQLSDPPGPGEPGRTPSPARSPSAGGTTQAVVHGYDTRGNQNATKQGTAVQRCADLDRHLRSPRAHHRQVGPGRRRHLRHQVTTTPATSRRPPTARGKTVSYSYDALNRKTARVRRTGRHSAGRRIRQPARRLDLRQFQRRRRRFARSRAAQHHHRLQRRECLHLSTDRLQHLR